MAPAERRAGKASACHKWSLGDLVLAKVKGFPVWPAKISKPEDWEQTHDPRKVFVYFFGTTEIGFCAPTDIQAFTVESKNKLSAKCCGKTETEFTLAVKEICEEYDKLEMEKQDVTPEIHKMKSRSCVDSSNNSAEKIHFKDVKMQSPTHDSEEVCYAAELPQHLRATAESNDEDTTTKLEWLEDVYNQLQTAHDTLLMENATLITERDTARAERDTAIQERDTARRERGRYYRHREALRAKYGDTGTMLVSGAGREGAVVAQPPTVAAATMRAPGTVSMASYQAVLEEMHYYEGIMSQHLPDMPRYAARGRAALR